VEVESPLSIIHNTIMAVNGFCRMNPSTENRRSAHHTAIHKVESKYICIMKIVHEVHKRKWKKIKYKNKKAKKCK